MRSFLMAAAGLHAIFMMCELFPWPVPVLLRIASKKLPKQPDGEAFSTDQRKLVAAIVHNAGIYNGIMAGGLLWAAFVGTPATDVAKVMLIGAAVAGAFGTVTLKSPVTAIQCVVGIVGLLLL